MEVTIFPLKQEVIAEEKVKLQRYFVSGKGKDTPITSLYFRAQSDRREQLVNLYSYF